MRIVVWNCRMALAKKREQLFGLCPDIAVIPECSRDSMLACKADGYDTRWWGDNKHKGLGVVAAKPWTLENCGRNGHQPSQKLIAPIRVRGPHDFLLLAVWACPVGGVREINYVGQTYEAIVRHPRWFAPGMPTLLCGDFNSNIVFDPGRKRRIHASVVKLLSERNIVSVYHSFFGEAHGTETRPTYYFWHRQERCFHIEYIFLPHRWMDQIVDVTVGDYKRWRPLSDHVPVCVEIMAEAASDAAAAAPIASRAESFPTPVRL